MMVALSGVFGLVFGSFLNVVIHRIPAGKSIASPPSACPTCGNEIKPRDNIPLLSWLLLGGKCRSCRAPISVRYPLVEAGTAVFFIVVAIRFVGSIFDARAATDVVAAVMVLIAFLYLAAVSIALAMIDLDTHTLPNRIVLPSYVVAAALLGGAGVISGDYEALLRVAIAAAALWVFYFVLAFAYPGGMGLGDVKLAGVLGLYLGWVGWGSLLVGGFGAFLLGGVFSLVLLASRRATRKSGIPFGPWMLAGAWLGILFGEPLWSGYLALFGLA